MSDLSKLSVEKLQKLKDEINGILMAPVSNEQNGCKDGNGQPSVLQANDDSLSDDELDAILNQRSPSYNFIQDEIEFTEVDENFPMACGESNQYAQESNEYAQQSNQTPTLEAVVTSRMNRTHLVIDDGRRSEYKKSFSTKKKFVYQCCKLSPDGKACPKKYDVSIDPALTFMNVKKRKNDKQQSYLDINPNVNKSILFDKAFYKLVPNPAQEKVRHTCVSNDDDPNNENMEKEITTKIKAYLYDNFQALRFSSPNSIKRQILELLSHDYTYDELVANFPNQQKWEQLYRYYREANSPVREALESIEDFEFNPEDFLVNSRTIIHKEGADLYFYDEETIKQCIDISVIQAGV
ncbi:Oidioi.mRNA.OKI2018_I69.PAR.g10781.t1.cds [Oikopleura dioica]|uniref:Oidioi.mRNA.OKI2018_I69.PAR.g10781.t1.cds n=1 Tax=Oikopleura dioica TaxID=34765 RepID=A0ABN7RWR6_OIKDI|nr:Oidioi.mRNA.OKI2018_I69.PAR.g10781.t1.cds [Oikopleura dioica]